MTRQEQVDDAPILITGAGRRVGRHLAMRLLEQGYRVIAHIHHDGEEVQALRQRGAAIVQADLSDQTQVLTLSDQIKMQYPALRGVIHNASCFARTDTDPQQAARQFDQFYRVHMLAPFLLNQTLRPLLQACTAECADIIHISDIYADKPNPAFDIYCASKAGLQNLALSHARQFAPKIKVNVIQPGPILFKEWHDAAMRQQVLNETLLKKEGGAEAIALAVLALLNNPYQTAAVIAVDGGRRMA